jgi:hypothetical protein
VIADRERLTEEIKMAERVSGSEVLLEVNGLRKYFPIQRGFSNWRWGM